LAHPWLRASGCLASSQVGISETDLVTGERTSFFFANIGDILPFFTIKKWGFHGDSTNNFQVFISGFDDVQQNGGIHPEKKNRFSSHWFF